mmetsp:Transcript_13334/g.25097  ORF Transcript_13334/g.25097 Transcript_13334/m.25097 type:complete len:376 (+) Transcript_13334:57-1184(+)
MRGGRRRAELLLIFTILLVYSQCSVAPRLALSCPSRRAAALGVAGSAVLLRSPSAHARQPLVFDQTIAESGLEDWSTKDYEAMRDDVPRTSRFEAAIKRRLASAGNATVVDIGTGPFALLALIAAKAGARKVYAVEKNAAAAAQAKETVQKEGLQDVVTVIEGDAMKVDLPERVDFVVSELIGSIATQEGVEPIIRDARKRFLKDDSGCGMIPSRCQTCVVPILYKGRSFMARLLSPFAGVRSRGKAEPGTNLPLRIKSADEENMEFLAEPQILEDFDYCSGESSTSQLQPQKTFEFKVDPSGSCRFSGFAMWTRVVVDETDVIEVRGQPDSHWAYVVSLMSPQPCTVEDGTIVLNSGIDYTASPVRYSFHAEVA